MTTDFTDERKAARRKKKRLLEDEYDQEQQENYRRNDNHRCEHLDRTIIVVSEPTTAKDCAFEPGFRISKVELDYMLRYGSFVAGTVLEVDGKRMIVCGYPGCKQEMVKV